MSPYRSVPAVTKLRWLRTAGLCGLVVMVGCTPRPVPTPYIHGGPSATVSTGPRPYQPPTPRPPVRRSPGATSAALIDGGVSEGTRDRVDQMGADLAWCRAELAAARVQITPVPDRDDGTGCAYTGAGTVDVDLGTVARLSPAGPLLSCPSALALSVWRRQVVEPAARDIFGQDVVQIDLMGAYSCRNVNGASTGRRSGHARGDALDVGGVRLRDGRRITVTANWTGESPEARFLRRIRDEGCQIYGTVLSPDYNAAHRDHLHLEVGGHPFCR